MGSEITALGSGITDHGIGISRFFRDQGSGCGILVGSGTKIGHAFGIKDPKFAFKNGTSEEKTYLVTTLLTTCLATICSHETNRTKHFLSHWCDNTQKEERCSSVA